jgi:hypothetical protein
MNGEKRRFISVEYQSPSVSISSLSFSPSRNCICIDVGAFGPYIHHSLVIVLFCIDWFTNELTDFLLENLAGFFFFLFLQKIAKASWQHKDR